MEQKLGQRWSEPIDLPAAPGAIAVRTDYVTAPFNHRVRNIDEDRRMVLLAVASKVPMEAEPSEADGEMREGVIDNPWFKVRALTLGAGSSSEAMRFERDAVVMQAEAGDSHLETGDAEYGHMSRSTTFAFVPAGQQFIIRSRDDAEVRLVLVEIKR